jgi:poly-gamma-glutamate capsule biosynthesis protein CapA/YwtB (metallophosphatase superfamily)
MRHRASLLFFAALSSFLVGFSYGAVQKYLYLQQLAWEEELSDISLEIASDIPLKATTEIIGELTPAKTNIKIKAVGDIVPGTNYPHNRLHPQSKILFQAVKPILKGADLLFGNFEGTLTNYPYSPKGTGGGLLVAFRSPPSYNQLLKDAGFDVLSVANNHSFDFDDQGFKDTINNLEKVGIKAVGKKNQIVITKRQGISVAWIGFSYFEEHNSLHNLKLAKALVKKARENADIVVISVHAGAEGTGAMNVRNRTEYFFGENRGNLMQFSRTMIDHGVDLILGHSPHVPRAFELYKGKLIAYSLGNFMGYQTLATDAQLGYSLVLEVEMNKQGDFVNGKIIPVQLNRVGIPYPDKYGNSIKLIRQLIKSDFPHTSLIIDKHGKIVQVTKDKKLKQR